MRRAIIPAAFIMILAGAPGGLSFAATAPQSSATSAATAPASTSNTQSTIDVIPANQVVGRTLRDPSGADAGVVDSLVIDTRTGNVDFLLVGSSGSFDTNGGDVALPWQALQHPQTGNGPITTKIDASKILHSPRINSARINELNQPGQRRRIYGYYGYQYPAYYRNGYRPAAVNSRVGVTGPVTAPAPALTQTQTTMAVPAGPAGNQTAAAAPAANAPAPNLPAPSAQVQAAMPGGATQQAQAKPAPAEPPQTEANGALIVTRNAVTSTLEQRGTTSTKALQNASVYDRSGQALGSISTVMIDAKRGEVAYILLSRGGFLGLSQRWYALPVEALVPAPYRGGYRLTADAKTLLAEPQFSVDPNNLPTLVNEAQLASLYQQFGMTPYWEANRPEQAAAVATPNKPRTHAAQPPQKTAAK